MELFQPLAESPPTTLLQAPPCVARFSAIFWEPVVATGERVVALIAIEPHESSSLVVSAGTYCVIPAQRLRAMLGRQRGTSAYGVLREAADFLTARQQAGLPVAELQPPFHGFTIGPAMVTRGYDVEQLLDAAVRSVSAFGVSEEMIEEEEPRLSERHSVKTSEFLKAVKRRVLEQIPAAADRFERKLKPRENLPQLTVDYAFGRWMVQVTSLPATTRQTKHSLLESQSKLLELQLLRDQMDGNGIQPVLLINEDIGATRVNTETLAQADEMRQRLIKLTQSLEFDLKAVESVAGGAQLVSSLV